jgi:multiple sugar transport system permease protein
MKKSIRIINKAITYILLIAIGFIFVAPFLFMISMSLASEATNVKGTFSLIPHEFNWDNYIKVFTGRENLGLYIKNSIFFTTWCVIGQVFASSFVAFGFARVRGRGKQFWFILLLSTLMIPQDVYLIPQFMLFKKLNWLNTYLPMIVPNFCGGAFNIFLMRQFFMTLPTSLDEAAKIDGLSYFGIYRRIVLPLMKPILITIGLFTFQFNWGWFNGPLIFIQDKNKYPLAVALKFIQSSTGNAVPNWHLVMVGAMFLTLPPLITYFFGQKYILEANINLGSASIK